MYIQNPAINLETYECCSGKIYAYCIYCFVKLLKHVKRRKSKSQQNMTKQRTKMNFSKNKKKNKNEKLEKW